MYEILQRQVPEQLVLTEQRHVRVPELPAWLDAAMMRLTAPPGPTGAWPGPPSWSIHGEVNEDGDGPVEVCVPIDPTRQGVSDTAMRREAAHDEAYVRLKKAQVEFPQILTAYDAVAQWIGASGCTHSGPPREVYFAEFGTAAPEDEVCDVAFPVR